MSTSDVIGLAFGLPLIAGGIWLIGLGGYRNQWRDSWRDR